MKIKLEDLKLSNFISFENRLSINSKMEGLYFIYNENKELMYLGKAKDIRGRLTQHISNSYNNALYGVRRHFKYFRFVIVECQTTREIYETYYINKLKPLFNRDKVFTYKTQFYNEKYNDDYLDVNYYDEDYKNALKDFRKRA